MIVITVALPQESQDFARHLHHGGELTVSERLPTLLGNLGSHEVLIAHTGVGADSTRAAMEELFARHAHSPIRALISSGFAGGLDNRLRIGDIVIAENYSAPELLATSRKFEDASIFYGTLTTQRNPAETVASKFALARETGALAVDMETGVIFEACNQRSIPMLSVRGISDTVSQALPVPFPVWFDAEKQKPRVGGLLRHLVRHPSVIPRFARFATGVSAARESLTSYLLRLVREL